MDAHRHRIARRSGGLVFSAVLLAAGMIAVGSADADIRQTKHNLARQPGQSGMEVDAKEVCVFCHFPRISDPEAASPPASGPLWQPSAVDSMHTFEIYDDIGRLDLDGASPVGSPSVACLSCHDANQALDSDRKKGEHPFGVPYRGSPQVADLLDVERRSAVRSGMAARIARPAEEEPDYRPALESRAGGRRIFWTSAREDTSRRAKGDLPLFGRRIDGAAEDIPFIECSTCHDPHTARTLFLRASSDGSELCMTCHQK